MCKNDKVGIEENDLLSTIITDICKQLINDDYEECLNVTKRFYNGDPVSMNFNHICSLFGLPVLDIYTNQKRQLEMRLYTNINECLTNMPWFEDTKCRYRVGKAVFSGLVNLCEGNNSFSFDIDYNKHKYTLSCDVGESSIVVERFIHIN